MWWFNETLGEETDRIMYKITCVDNTKRTWWSPSPGWYRWGKTDVLMPIRGHQTRKPSRTDVSMCKYGQRTTNNEQREQHGGLGTTWVVQTFKTNDDFPPLSGNE